MSDGPFPIVFDSHTVAPAGWDDFVMECDPSHFEQTSWWGNVESEDGWRYRYVAGRVKGRIAAGAMVLVRRLGRLCKVGYVVRGPLTSSWLPDSEPVRRSLAAALQDFAFHERLALMVVVPPYDGDALAATLLSMGFLRHPPLLPPSSLPPGTITVDLRKSIREIEQGYRATIRWQVNKAARNGVVVELGTAKDLEVFWERHLELCRRRGVGSNVPGYAYVRRLWQEFHAHGRAWLVNARLGEEVLCSLFCLGAGKWLYVWRIGWNPYYSKDYPTQAAHAHAIRAAAEAGYSFFDFMEIHPDEVELMKQGRSVNTPSAGVTFFKLGFGGAVRRLPVTLDWFPNPALRMFMGSIGPRLLSCGSFLRLARRMGAMGR